MRNPMEKLNSSNIILDQHRISEERHDGSVPTSSSTSGTATVNGTGVNSNPGRVFKDIDPFSGEVIQYSKNEKVNRLAKEVQEAISMDPLYGPRSDRERQIIGTEYEIVLEQILRSMSE